MGSPTKFGGGVVAKIFDLTTGKLVAPEQLLISPRSLAPESNMNVMRIKEMTANCGSSSLKDKFPWSLPKNNQQQPPLRQIL